MDSNAEGSGGSPTEADQTGQRRWSSTDLGLMPISGTVVGWIRSTCRLEPLTEDDAWQAQVEIFALGALLWVVGFGVGMIIVGLDHNLEADLLFAAYVTAMGVLVGLAIPLQFVLWHRLERADLRRARWRHVPAAVTAAVGCLVAVLMIL